MEYVKEIEKNNHQLTIPCLDVLFIIYTSEPKQDENTNSKKTKK